MPCGDAADMVDAVAIGQYDVGDEHIGHRDGERPLELCQAVGDADVMAAAAQRLGDNCTDRRIVVDDEDRAHAAARGRSRRRTVISGNPSRAY